MALRRIRVLAVATALVASGALPALAAEENSVATSFAGRIVTDTLGDDTGGSDSPTYEVVGDCTYVGTQSGNRMVLKFTGGVAAYGPGLAQGAAVYCDVRSMSGTVLDHLEFVLPLAVSVAPPQDTAPIPVQPVKICAWGTAYFGPTPVHEEQMPEVCKDTLI